MLSLSVHCPQHGTRIYLIVALSARSVRLVRSVLIQTRSQSVGLAAARLVLNRFTLMPVNIVLVLNLSSDC